MANRRLGGMGGPRGNRLYSQQQHQPFQGNNVSPWQGNVPSNNSLTQAGLLGQLASNPQQLALALTNLLQPQQQQMNNPPSLLSLNTSPAFSHQVNRDSINRFGNRGRPDFRRNEPYNNKSRNGGGGGGGGVWRALDSNKSFSSNRSRSQSGSNRDNRKKSPQRSRNQGGSDKRKQDRKDEKPKAEKSSSKDDSKTDVSMSEEGRDEENAKDTKRDWKEEKKSGGDEKIDDDVESGDDEKKEKGGKDLAGKYFGVPQKLLHCFICNKDMWDGESFQKHIRGRAHKQMFQSLEESFHIIVNILRENMRLTEEKKVIELNRMHRLNKNKYRKFQEPESHCNMCDLKFLGKIIAHRKTDGHQRLKRFLHPKCEFCSKEFPSRLDWVEHRLTPEHLRRLNEDLENKKGRADGEIIEETVEFDMDPLLEECMELEDDHPILELTDDLSNLQKRIPAFKKNRPVATKNLKPFTGFMCDICHRSFENEAYAKAHLNTKGHYFAFIEAAKLKFKKQTEEAAAEAEKKKKRKREENDDGNEENESKVKKDVKEEPESENGEADADMYDPEEACNEEGEEEGDAEAEPEPKEEELEVIEEVIPIDEEELEEEEAVEPETVAVAVEVKEEKKVPPTTRAGRGRGGTAVRGRKARKQ